MSSFTKRKTAYLIGCLASAAMLSACGGSSNSSSDSNSNEEVAPPEVVVPSVIRGVINGEDPALSSGAFPSGTLPAASLPAGALPTIELDEAPSIAELRTLSIQLEAQQQVGNTIVEAGVPLTAVASVAVNETTGSIQATVTADNVGADDEVTMVHIHAGFAGENGPVLVGFTRTSDNPTVFTLDTNISELASLPGNDLESFSDGGWYVNLHTTSNPSGHVRGQIFTDDISVSRSQLQGKQENPAVINAEGVSGVGYVTVNADELEIVANVSVEGFVPFLDAPIGPVHIHSGFAGENGPVFLPLPPVEGSQTVFRATELDAIGSIDFERIANGGSYINVHSAENGSGEVRGQVVPEGITVARTELQGKQENPAITNAAGISGVGYVTVNAAGESLVANVSVEGFIPFLDAPIGPIHLHSGYAGVNGPVFLPLSPVGDSQTQYSGTQNDSIDAIDYELIAKGGTYINVHSAENGSGEVRGQIVMQDVAVIRTELQTQQTVPAVTTPSADGVSGVGYLTLNTKDATVSPVANVRVSGFEATMVHVHRGGVAGVAGPVQIGLTDVSPDDAPGTLFNANDGDIFSLQGLLNGVYYFNAHSAANPSGEIRGQLLTDDVRAFKTQLTGSQALPTANPTTATGVSFLTVNLQSEAFNANVQVQNFEPTPAFVSLNIAGDANTVFTELTDQGDGFFSAQGQVNNLQGLLNGGYSIQASDIAP